MAELAITCDSCERTWSVDHPVSVYEQEALESRPCPECGACTLSVVKRSGNTQRRQMRNLVRNFER